MYLVLLLLISIILIISFIIFDKDILSPTVISSTMYLCATICAIIGMLSWNNQAISFRLVLYIILALISFGLGEWIGRRSKNKKNTDDNIEINSNAKEIKKINIKKWKIIVIIIFITITILLMFLEIKRIANSLGYTGNNISKMISKYRTSSSLFNENAAKEGYTINFVVSQMKKVCDILCVVLSYIIINNFFCRENIKKYIKDNFEFFIAIILCIILSLLTSGRAQLMKYIVAAIMIYAISLAKTTEKKHFYKQIFKVASVSAIATVFLFYTIIPLLGRKTDKGLISYMTFYLGSSIPSFERYLENPPESDGHFGSETLYGIQTLLNKLHISDYETKISREWTTFVDEETGQRYKSNIYTAVRRYVNDYGVLGVIICPLIFGFCFYKLYEWAKNKKDCKYLIFYAVYAYMLFDQIRDELFFTRFININTIINLILVIVITWGMFEFEFSNMEEYKNHTMKIMDKIKGIIRKEKNENTK